MKRKNAVSRLYLNNFNLKLKYYGSQDYHFYIEFMLTRIGTVWFQ